MAPIKDQGDEKNKSTPSHSFTPSCSCKAFKDTGSCKHIPPPLPATAEAAQASGTNVLPNAAPQFPPSPTAEATQEPAMPSTASVAAGPPPTAEVTQEPAMSSTGLVGDDMLHLPPFQAELTFGEVLGKGASGATALLCTARLPDSSVPIRCAAKVLPLGPTTFPDMIESFGQEVALHGRLQHASIVKFIGSKTVQPSPVGDEVQKAYVLLTELCDGGTLLELLHRRRSTGVAMTTAEAQHVLLPLSSALAYLHDQAILHRDLKAANVFAITKNDAHNPEKDNGTLLAYAFKLGDFDAGVPRSRAQTPCQTPQWMSPEAMSMEGYGRAADIWSFGMLIFELIELGAPPYGVDIMLPKLEALITAGEPPELSQPGKFPELEDLMRRCIHRNPGDRPTAQSLASELAIVDPVHAPSTTWVD